MEGKDVRWKQRFANYQLAMQNLKEGIEIKNPSELEKSGIIQVFEYTFELAWKTMKDFLLEVDIQVNFPRDVLKSAFSYEIIKEGDIWIDMLEKRNLMSHTYHKENAKLAYSLVKNKYYAQLNEFEKLMKTKL